MERKKVIKVGVEGPRKLEWFEPRELEGREPAVYTVIIGVDGSYTKCGAYCVIAYRYPRHRGPRRRAQRVESTHFFTLVPRIKAMLGDGYTAKPG
jgi:hypothetical protein